MKEQTLIEMKNKIQSLTNVAQHMMNELEYLRTVSMGTLETIKHMPDYEEALGKIKEKINKEKDGVKQQDTK
jgi:gas vesicle protein|tara:strand:- start:203 stop:418 length:216 start_codon:yes stop_codon:yes gene_type:complete